MVMIPASNVEIAAIAIGAKIKAAPSMVIPGTKPRCKPN